MIVLLKKKKVPPATLKFKIIRDDEEYEFEYVYLEVEPLEYDGVITRSDRVKLPLSLRKPRTKHMDTEFKPGRYKLTMFGKPEGEDIVALDDEQCNISYVGEGVLAPGENGIVVDFHDDRYTLNGEPIVILAKETLY